MAPRRSIRGLIGPLVASAALLLCACGPRAPITSAPRYLSGQMRRFPPQSGGLTPYQTNGPRSLFVLHIADSENGLFLSTTGGIYRSEDGEIWHKASTGLEDDAKGVGSLVQIGRTLFAGTSGGLYRSPDGGNSWQLTASVIGRQTIQGLTKIDNTLFALTAAGIYRSEIVNQREGAWKLLLNPDSGRAQVYNVAAIGGVLYVTADRSPYQSDDRGDSWKPETNPGLPAGWQSLASVGGTLVAAEGESGGAFLGGIYMRDDRAHRWLPAVWDPQGPCASAHKLAVAGDTIWAGGLSGLCRSDDKGKTWQNVTGGPHFVTALYSGEGALFAGTADGLYVTRDRGASWKRLEAGLEETVLSATAVTAGGGKLFVATYGGIYTSDDRGASWRGISSGLTGTPVNDLAVLHNQLLLATGTGVYRYDEHANSWQLTSPWLNPPNIWRLAAVGDRLVAALPGSGIFVSDDQGIRWRQSVNGLGSQTVQSLLVTGTTVFAGTANGVYRSTDRGESWQWLQAGLENQSIGSLSGSEDAIVAGAYAGRVFRLEDPDHGNSWQALESDGLRGPVTALRVDSRHPNVLVACTFEGLFWSSDGGRSFRQWAGRKNGPDFHVAVHLASMDGQLFVSTDAGVFYLNDDIARVTPVARFKELVTAYPDWFRAGLLVALVSILLSSRLILLLLQLDVWGIKNIAPAVYLTAWGRWKLYRRYRAAVAGDAEMRDHSERYVDLPYEWPSSSPEEMRRKLSERIGELPPGLRLMLIAQGGRGKTTLCHHIAVCATEGRLRFRGRRVEPVIVEALGYTGSLLEAVTSSLKRRKAYVNGTIVESQLLTGRLLIIVDGFSEIRQSCREAADSSDIPKFVKDHPDAAFVFASRSPLPPAVRDSLGSKAAEVKLRDLDAETERPFLSRYLARGEQEVDSVLGQIKSNFPDLPLIPLMLTLIARVYDESGQIPTGRAKLFGQYAGWILRPEATGLDDPAGLDVALRHLVSETYLKSGDRGMTVEQGVEALSAIKDKLKEFDIDLSALKLVNLFVRSGLYRRVGENLKFFHDSFESYYGARALESAFHNKSYDYLFGFKINPTFSETWEFLNEILAETQETKRLEEALAAHEKKSVASV